jgi:hypothetical protein
MKSTTVMLSALLLLVAGCGSRAGGADDLDDAGAATDASQHDGAQRDGALAPDGAHPADGAAAPDGGPLPDGSWPADGGPEYGIRCGTGLCTPVTNFCCVGGTMPEMGCVPVDAVGPMCDFGARCDGPEDCAGGSCCGPSGAINQTWCSSGATCPSGQKLCHTTDDCGVVGETCCPSVEWGWPHSVCTPGAMCPS